LAEANAVYDVTQYLKDHPGGADPLVELAGQDATSAYEDVGHSPDAREIMHPFLVGSLAGASPKAPDRPSKPVPATFQVVRRGPGQKDHGTTSKFLSPRVEFAGLAMCTGGLAWLAGQTSVWHSLSSAGAHGGFAQGFPLAGGTSAAVAFGGMRWFQNVSQFGPGYGAYPAHIATSHTVESSHHPIGSLVPTEYRKFKLGSKTELSPGIWKFVFALPISTSVLGLPIGQHIAIRGYVEDHTVVRSYTPVSNNRDLGRLELLIRIYPGGQLGKYLSAI
jgi:cytochrome-b5 reductase